MAALQKWHAPGEASHVSEDPDATRAQPRLRPDVEGHHPDPQRNSTVTTMLACEIGTVIIPPLGKMRLGKMRLKQEKIVKSGVKNVSTVLHWLVQILALSPSSCVSLGTSFDIL